MTLLIDPARITETDRIRQDLGDVQALADSIEKVGLLHPIVVDHKHRLIAGSRRLAAVRLLNWHAVPVTVITDLTTAAELLIAERDENTCRKDFKVVEALALQDRLTKIERPKAKVRQGTRTDLQEPCSKLEQGSPGKVRHLTAKPTGFGATTLDKARKVVETAQDPSEDPKIRSIAKAEIERMDAGGPVDLSYRTVETAKGEASIRGFEKAAELRDPELARNKYRESVYAALIASHKRGLFVIDPDKVADVADADLHDALIWRVERTRKWCDDIEAALNRSHLATVTEISK